MTNQKNIRSNKEDRLSVKNLGNKYGRRGGMVSRSSSRPVQQINGVESETRAQAASRGGLQWAEAGSSSHFRSSSSARAPVEKMGPPPKPPDPAQMLEDDGFQSMEDDDSNTQNMQNNDHYDVVMGDASGHPQGS